MSGWKLTCVTAGFVLIAGGCWRFESSYPEKRSYVLEVKRKGDARPTEVERPLIVPRFRVASPYAGKGFVYRKDRATYESDYYNEFFALPGAMLTEAAREWFTQSGLFRIVPDSADLAGPFYSLKGTVMALYGDFTESRRAYAVIEIEFSVTREDQSRSQVLYGKRFSERVPLRGDSAEGLVAGWNEALAKILGALEADLSGMALESEKLIRSFNAYGVRSSL